MRLGPGSARGQAHIVSCSHFPYSEVAVLLSHVATCVPLLQPYKPPCPGTFPAPQGLTSLCCSLTTLKGRGSQP